MASRKKNIMNILFMIICFALTMYYVFHDQDLEKTLHYMKRANSLYWLLGIACVICFILSESAIIYYILNTLKHKVKFSHCCLYSFVGFFFSCITPSASGGQPVQAVFMKKDGIPYHVSTIVLLMVTIAYKMVLLLYGVIVLLFQPDSVLGYIGSAMAWVYLGIFLNLIVVGFMILLSVKPTIMKILVMGIFNFLSRIIKSRRLLRMKAKAENAMEAYVVKSEFLLTHKKTMMKILAITFVQRTILFFITYLVFVSFGYRGLGPADVTVLQGLISVAVDMLPLPGGMGISEHLFMVIFKPLLGADFTVPAMIVSRGISYYTQLIISAILTGIAYVRFFGRKEKE